MLVDAVVKSAVDVGRTDLTIEKTPGSISREEPVDIEHVPVKNDPRTWSSFRKVWMGKTRYFLYFETYGR
jgi:hypothetical protein